MNAALPRISKRRPTLSRDRIGTVAVSLLLYAGGCVLPLQEVGPGGFSTKRLEAVTTAMQAAVDRGEAGGIVTLLFRHGEVA